MEEAIVIQPKTLRLRPQDVDDLRYLVLLSEETEGAVMRTLLALTAQAIRTEAIRLRPTLATDPQWWGNGGTSTWPEDRRAWTAWLTAQQREGQGLGVPERGHAPC